MLETILFFLVLLIMLYTASQLYLGYRSEGGLGSDWQAVEEKEAAPSSLRNSLRTMKLEIEPLVFVTVVSMIAIVVFLLFLELFPDAVMPAILASLALIFLAFSLLGDLARWRTRRFETNLVDAIDLLQAALQSGATPLAALSTAANISKGAVKTEFEELCKRLELGMSIERATSRMVRLYDSEGVRLFTQILIAKWNAGGDLLMLLRSVNRIIRDRLKLRLKIMGQLAGARYALLFVAIIPYMVIPVFLWKDRTWLDILTQHRLGPTFLLAAVLLQVVGFFWMRRILRTDQ